MSDGLVDGEDVIIQQTGGHLPGRPTGDLPVRIDIRELRGERRGEDQRSRTWAWIASNTVLVNTTDEPLTFRIYLTASYTDAPAVELEATGSPLRLGSQRSQRGTQHSDLVFLYEISVFDKTILQDPDGAAKSITIVLIEVGTERELRIPFRTVTPPPSVPGTPADSPSPAP